MRRRDDKKHEAICNASLNLINSIGFAETSMSKIAKVAKVSPATIYTYFENKEDLLNQVYLLTKRKLRNGVLEGVNSNLEVEAAIKFILKNTFNYCINHPEFFTFHEQFANSPLINRVNVEEAYSYYKPIFDLLERGKKENIIKNIPDDIINAFTFFPMMQLAKGHLSGHFVLSKKDITTVVDLAWDAITP